MRRLAIAVGVLISSKALAFDPEFRKDFNYKPTAEWEVKALPAIKNVSNKVSDTMWGRKGSLWIEVKRDGTNWNIAGRSFCATLIGAGMPQNTFVIISFWRDSDIIAKVNCG